MDYSLKQIIDIDVLHRAFKECKKRTAWKYSIQSFEFNLLSNLFRLRDKLLYDRHSIISTAKKFKLNERGKIRDILSVSIEERIVQKALATEILQPLLTPRLIYDNSSSIKGKGVYFARKRLITHLSKHYRQFGNEGYILLLDFSKYFETINQDTVVKQLSELITDNELVDLFELFIKSHDSKGLSIGSEISQLLAVYYPNKLDHFIKERLKIKGYARYMDDSYLIHKDKEYLKYCYNQIIPILNELDIKVNPNKVRLHKLSSNFIFLKGVYSLTSTGKVINRPVKKTIHRFKRKLRKMIKLYHQQKVSMTEINIFYTSALGTFKQFKDKATIKYINIYYNNLTQGLKRYEAHNIKRRLYHN